MGTCLNRVGCTALDPSQTPNSKGQRERYHVLKIFLFDWAMWAKFPSCQQWDIYKELRTNYLCFWDLLC